MLCARSCKKEHYKYSTKKWIRPYSHMLLECASIEYFQRGRLCAIRTQETRIVSDYIRCCLFNLTSHVKPATSMIEINRKVPHTWSCFADTLHPDSKTKKLQLRRRLFSTAFTASLVHEGSFAYSENLYCKSYCKFIKTCTGELVSNWSRSWSPFVAILLLKCVLQKTSSL